MARRTAMQIGPMILGLWRRVSTKVSSAFEVQLGTITLYVQDRSLIGWYHSSTFRCGFRAALDNCKVNRNPFSI
jgi:hypothetical protein